MHKIIGFLVFICFIQTSTGQYSRVIRIKTKNDSISIYDFSTGKFTKRYRSVYRFKNPGDSAFVELRAGCGREGMDPSIKCSKSYRFIDSIPDGAYKIVIDNKPIEKVSFVDGKKNGLLCKYNWGGDRRLYYVLNFKDDRVIDFYRINKKGNVLEYSPCVRELAFKAQDDFIYLFDKKGRLKGIRYTLMYRITDYFSKDNTLLMSRPKYGKDVHTERDKYQLQKIKRRGISIGEKLTGMMEMNYNSLKYIFNYKDGVLVSWEHQSKYSSEARICHMSSDEIEPYRPDISEFCRE